MVPIDNYLNVECLICHDTTLSSLNGHLRVHSVSIYEYRTLFPGARTECIETEERRIAASLMRRSGYDDVRVDTSVHNTRLEAYLASAKLMLKVATQVERAREYGHKYYYEHRAQYATNFRRWRLENPKRLAINSYNYQARRAGAEGTLLITEFFEKCNHLGNVCGYCGKKTKLERDHMIPLLRGGSNGITNTLPVCRSCNAMKGNKTPEEFAQYLNMSLTDFYYQKLSTVLSHG